MPKYVIQCIDKYNNMSWYVGKGTKKYEGRRYYVTVNNIADAKRFATVFTADRTMKKYNKTCENFWFCYKIIPYRRN